MKTTTKYRLVSPRLALQWLVASLICLCVLNFGTTHASPMRLEANNGNPSVAGHLSMYLDRSGEMSFDQAVAHKESGGFTPVVGNEVAAGFINNGALWLHLTLEKTEHTPTDWVLSLSADTIDLIDLYIQQPDGTYLTKKGGRAMQSAQREFLVSGHAFRLVPATASRQEVYVRLATLIALRFAVEVWQEVSFDRFFARDNFLFGMYFGSMSLVFLVSLFRTLKNLNFTDALYTSYIGSMEAANLFAYGYPQQFGLFDDWLVRIIFGQSGIVVAGLSLIWLVLVLIAWPQHVRHRLKIAAFGFTLACLLTLLIVLTVAPRTVPQWIMVFAGLVITFSVSLGAWSARNGWAQGKAFLFAFSPFFVAVAAMILTNFGVIKGFYLTRNLSFLATVFHAVFLYLAVFSRDAILQRAREKLEWNISRLGEELSNQTLFLHMLTHEVRTPLAIIDNNSQLLSMQYSGEISMMRFLGEIRTAVARIAELLNRYLSQFRLMSLNTIQKEPVDLAALLSRVADEVQRTTENPAILVKLSFFLTAFPQTGHTILTHFHQNCWNHLINCRIEKLPAAVMIDPDLFRILITNLLENAVKYSPEGGSIEIAARMDKTRRVAIEVRDEGVGIPETELEHIFQRYVRTQQVEGVSGAGLGLYLVKNIAQLHGADVICKSTLGEGSTFFVTLAPASE